MSVTCSYRNNPEHHTSPKDELPAQPGWVQVVFLEEVTVEQCPKGCPAAELFNNGKGRESLMSGHTKDFGLRVLDKVKNFLLLTIPTGFGRWRAGQELKMAKILMELSSSEE